VASIYRAVVQAVLLYGAESWVLTKAMEQTLQSFHHRCARYITEQHIRQNKDESWTCPPSAYVLNLTGFLPIQEYIKNRRKSVEKYVFSRPIYQQCVQSRPLARNANRAVWWQKLPDGPGDNLSYQFPRRPVKWAAMSSDVTGIQQQVGQRHPASH
jgi:hypothetical protein